MATDPLDAALLGSYADEFYGYGHYRAPFWFVGLEEGGGDQIEVVRARLEAWDKRGRRELEDLKPFHRAFGENRWFDGSRPLQPTWGRLIRIFLAAAGRDLSLGSVRRYQAEELGRSAGDVALLELLPLPSPSVSHWKYSEWSPLPQLRTRTSYREYYGSRRAEYLRGKRDEYRPLAVFFYSRNAAYQRWWESISGVPLHDQKVDGHSFRIGDDERTVSVVIPHPAAPGLSRDFFHRTGQLVQEITNRTGRKR